MQAFLDELGAIGELLDAGEFEQAGVRLTRHDADIRAALGRSPGARSEAQWRPVLEAHRSLMARIQVLRDDAFARFAESRRDAGAARSYLEDGGR